MDTAPSPLLRCRDLAFGYGSRPVLCGVDFCAAPGEHVALIGPNGAGKSTLLHCLSGLYAPRAGSVELEGRPLAAFDSKERARRIAVVPQRGEAVPRISVEQFVLLGRYPYLSLFGTYGPEDYAAAREAMEATHCRDLAGRMPASLSGGEMQRVLLARALAQQSPVLLLDELSAGLDAARMSELFDLLEERRRAGICCVSVMHDLNLAALYATRIAGLKDGRLLFDGPTEAVFTATNLNTLFDARLHPVRHPATGRPQVCPQEPGRSRFAGTLGLLLCLCLALSLFLGAPARAAIMFTDDGGTEIVLEESARRIVPLYGAFGEMLAAVGLERTIIARTEADQVPNLAHLPSVGTHMRPNPELIAALKPDLVLMLAGRRDAEQQARDLRRLGLRVACFGMDSFEDIFTVLGTLGCAAGAPEAAAALEADMRARLAAVAARTAGKEHPTVFFEVRYPNLLGAGKTSIVSEIIAGAGGRNVVETEVRLARLNEEELLRLDPDVYIAQRGPMNSAFTPLAARPHFAPLKALRRGRILEVDERLFSRPGPASVEAVERLAAYLHPGAEQEGNP